MKAFAFSSCVLTAALASSLAFAAPDPAYVPAKADLVVVGHHLNVKGPYEDIAIEKLKATGRYEETPLSDLAEVNPHLPAMLKALVGYSDDGLSMTTTSALCSIVLPEKFPEAPGEVPAFSVNTVIENPAMDLPAFTAALKEVLKDDEGSLTLVESEGWTILRDESDLEGAMPFIGYHAVPGGALFAVTDNPENAKALLARTAPTIAGTSTPLLKAFTPQQGAEGGSEVIVLKSIKELVDRFVTEPEAQSFIAIQAPYLMRANDVTLKLYAIGTNVYLTIEVATDDEATATEISEQLIGFKMMALQLVRGSYMLPADSALLAQLSKIKISAEGTTAKLALTLSIDDIIACYTEIVKQAEASSVSTMLPSEDPDLEWPEEEEDDVEIEIEEAPATK